MLMPTPDAGVISKRAKIVNKLKNILPKESVISEEAGLRVYECDGLTAYRQLPLVVVLPETKEQLSRVLRFCNENNVTLLRTVGVMFADTEKRVSEYVN